MHSMTEGNVTKRMLQFAMPLLLGNLLQQCYHMADTIIIGRFAGKNALAAVGAAAPVMNVLLFLMVGISLGASVLMSEFFGAGEMEKIKKEEVTVLLSGLVFSAALSLAGFFLAKPLLMLIRVPEKILPDALGYLQIILLGLVFSFLYNIFSCALRSIGNSAAPFYFLLCSSVLNIFVSMVFVKNFGWGVRGAALGTILSQGFSALLCMGYIFWKTPALRFSKRDLRIDPGLLKQTASYSSVSAVQQTFLYIGVLVLQGAVNPLGIDTIAAYNVVTKIDGFILAPTDSLALALTTFISQNRGAKKPKRMGLGMKNAVLIGIIYCFLIAVLVFFAAPFLMPLFMEQGETNAAAIGVTYLQRMAFLYLLPAFCNAFQGFFRGLGKMGVTLAATVVQIPLRVAAAYLLAPTLGITAVVAGVGIGWICMILYELFKYRQYIRKDARRNETSI